MISQVPYDVAVGRLFAELQGCSTKTEWILESWGEYDSRCDGGLEGLRDTMRVQWKAPKDGGTISGSLFFNEALLVEAGPIWMADALADMVQGNIDNPAIQPQGAT